VWTSPDRAFILLILNAELLEKFPDFHVYDVFIHYALLIKTGVCCDCHACLNQQIEPLKGLKVVCR